MDELIEVVEPDQRLAYTCVSCGDRLDWNGWRWKHESIKRCRDAIPGVPPPPAPPTTKPRWRFL